MLEPALGIIYSALWADAAQHCTVLYCSQLFSNGEAGWFSPRPFPNAPLQQPQIAIVRPRVPQCDDLPDAEGATLEELCTLAHEVGHLQSHLTGQRTTEYAALVDARDRWPSLPTAAKNLILNEEVRAWDLGREKLSAIGFKEWAAFEGFRSKHLAIYLEMLRLPMAMQLGESLLKQM